MFNNSIYSLLTEAGRIALSYFNSQRMDYQHKTDKTIVTEADFKVEEFIRQGLYNLTPHYDVIGEEIDTVAETEFAWVIDPIDGTLPFIYKLPTWCISLGLTRNKEPFQGFVYVPVTDDFYYTDGEYSYKNGKKIFSISIQELDNETIFAISNFTHKYFKFDFENYPGGIISTGSGIYNNMLLASGFMHMTLSVKPNLWDLAAACAIVKNAGSDFFYYDGTDFKLSDVWNQKPVRKPLFFANKDSMSKFKDMFISLN